LHFIHRRHRAAIRNAGGPKGRKDGFEAPQGKSFLSLNYIIFIKNLIYEF